MNADKLNQKVNIGFDKYFFATGSNKSLTICCCNTNGAVQIVVLVWFEIRCEPVVDLKRMDGIIVSVGVGLLEELYSRRYVGTTVKKDLPWSGCNSHFSD